MEKPAKILSLLVSLAALGLVGCAGQGPASSIEDETSSLSPVEPVTLKVTGFPGEIGLGADHALNLDDYVEVTGAETYEIDVISGPVSLEGHVLTGTGYGDFALSVSAKDKSTRLEGRVVTDNRLELSAAISALSDNYTASIAISGQKTYNFRNENYIAIGSYLDETYNSYAYETSIIAPDGNAYFALFGTDLENVPFSDLIFSSGVDRTPDEKGYVPLTLVPSDFEDVYGRDGNPTGQYVLSDQEAISTFFASAFMYSWASLVQTSYAAQFLCTFEEGTLTMVAVNRNFYEVGLVITLEDIGTTEIGLVEDWLADPVYPAKIDTTPISSFLDEADASGSYHMSVQAAWVNTNNGSMTNVPSSMEDSNGYAPLFNYLADVYVTEDYVLTSVNYITDNVYSAYGDNGYVTDGVVLYSYNQGSPTTAKGSLVRDENGEIETVLWGGASSTTGVPPLEGYLYSLSGIDRGVLENGNFRSEGDDTTGTMTLYGFDHYGDGGALRQEMYDLGGFPLSSIYDNFGMFSLLENYLSDAIALSKDGTSLVFQSSLAYATSQIYLVSITVDSLGSGDSPIALPA